VSTWTPALHNLAYLLREVGIPAYIQSPPMWYKRNIS
jgi:hypothetical protein